MLVELISGFVACGLLYCWINNLFPIHTQTRLGLVYLGMLFLPITLVDFRHTLIPEIYTLTGIFTGFLVCRLLPSAPIHSYTNFFNPASHTLSSTIDGILLLPFCFWLLGYVMKKILGKDALGFGDVMLLAAAGSFFGFDLQLIRERLTNPPLVTSDPSYFSLIQLYKQFPAPTLWGLYISAILGIAFYLCQKLYRKFFPSRPVGNYSFLAPGAYWGAPAQELIPLGPFLVAGLFIASWWGGLVLEGRLG